MRHAARSDIPLNLVIAMSSPIPGDVSFVFEECGEMRELTQMEQDAVAGGFAFVVVAGNGSHNNNGDPNNSGSFIAGNFNGGNTVTAVGNTSFSINVQKEQSKFPS
jgi:hypothetical protein